VNRKTFERGLFEGFPYETRKMYCDMLYWLYLNIVAVERGYFEYLICDLNETTQDYEILLDYVSKMEQIQMWVDIDDAIAGD
jgi:hypothetical protein